MRRQTLDQYRASALSGQVVPQPVPVFLGFRGGSRWHTMADIPIKWRLQETQSTDPSIQLCWIRWQRIWVFANQTMRINAVLQVQSIVGVKQNLLAMTKLLSGVYCLSMTLRLGCPVHTLARWESSGARVRHRERGCASAWVESPKPLHSLVSSRVTVIRHRPLIHWEVPAQR